MQSVIPKHFAHMTGRGPVAALLAWGLLLAACARVGYLDLFSIFLPYDDEGLLMVSARLFLEGHRPYTEVTWVYGPAHLAWLQLVHGILGVPLSHAAVRYLTLVLWLCIALLSGRLVHALTGSHPWSIAGALVSFVFVQSIVNEPGHPQSLIALATLAIPLIPGAGHGRSAWLQIGALSALILLLKPNAGAYTLAAVGTVLLSRAAAPSARHWLLWGLLPATLAFPFVLMLPLLGEPYCARFAAIAALSAAAAAVTAFDAGAVAIRLKPACYGFLAGFTVVAVTALAYTLALAIWPPDILSSLLRYAGGQAAFYHFFREYSLLQVALAVLSLLLAVCASSLRPSIRHHLATLARIAFVTAGAYSVAVDDPAHAQAILGWAWPWCWTLVHRRRGAAGISPDRLLLALIAAWSPLLAYPIPGSQLYFGSLPLLLAVLVAGADLAASAAAWLHSRYPALRRSGGLERLVPCAVLVGALVMLYIRFESAGDRYRRHELLALPGTGPLRIEPRRADQYRRLVVAADGYRVVFTTFRLYSLYFWSGAGIPAPGSISSFPLAHASAEEQARARDGLFRADRALLIDRIDLARAREVGGGPAWVDREFVETGRVGPYRLLTRPGGARDPE